MSSELSSDPVQERVADDSTSSMGLKISYYLREAGREAVTWGRGPEGALQGREAGRETRDCQGETAVALAQPPPQ